MMQVRIKTTPPVLSKLGPCCTRSTPNNNSSTRPALSLPIGHTLSFLLLLVQVEFPRFVFLWLLHFALSVACQEIEPPLRSPCVVKARPMLYTINPQQQQQHSTCLVIANRTHSFLSSPPRSGGVPPVCLLVVAAFCFVRCLPRDRAAVEITQQTSFLLLGTFPSLSSCGLPLF